MNLVTSLGLCPLSSDPAELPSGWRGTARAGVAQLAPPPPQDSAISRGSPARHRCPRRQRPVPQRAVATCWKTLPSCAAEH